MNNYNKGTWIKRKSSQKQEQEEDDAKSDQNNKITKITKKQRKAIRRKGKYGLRRRRNTYE